MKYIKLVLPFKVFSSHGGENVYCDFPGCDAMQHTKPYGITPQTATDTYVHGTFCYITVNKKFYCDDITMSKLLGISVTITGSW
jgi:hypothetical protein